MDTQEDASSKLCQRVLSGEENSPEVISGFVEKAYNGLMSRKNYPWLKGFYNPRDRSFIGRMYTEGISKHDLVGMMTLFYDWLGVHKDKLKTSPAPQMINVAFGKIGGGGKLTSKKKEATQRRHHPAMRTFR